MEKFLLLSCCAPCSCAVIKRLAEDACDFDVVFYNPNVQPFKEYAKRCAENKRICDLYDINFIELEYDNDRWCEAVAGFESEPERGKRCDICFEMRLMRVMEYAKQNGINKVASVLGVSRYKDLNQVNRAALRASMQTGVEYMRIEGRKGGMQELRNKLTEELSLYRQDYCGCRVSSGG